MRVKIIKASGKDYWYRDQIGCIFDVVERNSGSYYLSFDKNQTYIIDKCDTERIKTKLEEFDEIYTSGLTVSAFVSKNNYVKLHDKALEIIKELQERINE